MWWHLVDRDAGVEIDMMPGNIATMLVGDLAGWTHTRVSRRVELQMPGKEPVGFGPKGSISAVVSGPAAQLAGWLTGRSDGVRLNAPGGLPELPAWI